MKILICDSSEVFIKELTLKIREVYSQEKISIECYTRDIESIKRKIETVRYDMAILGEKIDGYNGFRLGKYIKHILPNCMLIMACEKDDHIQEAFQCRAFQYLIRSNLKMLDTELIRAKKLYDQIYYQFEFESEDGPIRFLPNDILYIQTLKEETVVVTNDARVHGHFKDLDETMEALRRYEYIKVRPDHFINPDYLLMFRSEKIGLKNGDVIPIRYSDRKAVRAAIYKYCSL